MMLSGVYSLFHFGLIFLGSLLASPAVSGCEGMLCDLLLRSLSAFCPHSQEVTGPCRRGRWPLSSPESRQCSPSLLLTLGSAPLRVTETALPQMDCLVLLTSLPRLIWPFSAHSPSSGRSSCCLSPSAWHFTIWER